MTQIDDVKTDEFETLVLKSDLPVFVDFHATWCGPCKAMMPALEDIAREYQGEIKIVKVDIDAEPKIAETYGILGVPTFIMMQGGQAKERVSGGMTRGKLAAIFERFAGEAQ
ncbi:thioredoxin [Caulobacter radicis]|uniref:thioredoxin n=1 Tax=Caulobacter radicis TaxID=2172650 RepID=UPI000D56310B|nr:thioredoxin [Caulobacter radicis]PVM84477.1 thioredoxin [Caulobacter radicis]